MKWISFFLITSFMFLNSAFSVYKPKVIYGDDNRLDLYQVQDQAIAQVARSTAAQFDKTDLVKVGNMYVVTSKKYGDRFRLCAEEPYFEQPSSAQCSAFLVAPDLVATAGHCVDVADCGTTAYGFGYAMKDSSEAPTQLAEEDVYFCKAIMKRELTSKQDYSLVQLDKEVRGFDILKLSSSAVKLDEALTVVGHPSGLPTKVADGARVRSLSDGFFVANLDTYGGNSGSAVFNSETLEVEGILVRGERDFKYDTVKACYRSNICGAGDCRGEDVTDISFIVRALNTTYLE